MGVEEDKSLLVGLWGANDGKQPLATIVVWLLSDDNFRSGQSSDLRDSGASLADDRANHVRGDGDVLGSFVAGMGKSGVDGLQVERIRSLDGREGPEGGRGKGGE